MKPGPRSLQGRLLVLVLALVAGVWATAAAMTWLDVRHELDELLDAHLAQAAALLVAQQAGEIDDEDDLGVNAPSLHRYAPKVAFQVFHEGKLALRSSNAPTAPMLALPAGAEDGFRSVRMNDAQWRVFTTRGRESDTQVFVGEQVDSRDAILWAVMRSVSAPMAFAVPLLALAAWWAVRQGMAPLHALGRALGQRQPQTLQPIAAEGAPLEMQPMLEALNGLFERIRLLMAAERRFTADAAHELRTPIAAIRAQAQVALVSVQDEERVHALLATVQGCDRAARLVDQLLLLSRLDASHAPALARLDLAAAVRDVVADVAALAFAKGQTIEVEASAPGWIAAEHTLLSALVRNLVDNAIRYSPAGSRIRLRVGPARAGISLFVEDSGPGMSEPDMQRLGERFFRVAGSGQSGSGLGWSITRHIAAVLGATVAVSRAPALGGLCVELGFAYAAAAAPESSAAAA